MIQLEPHPGPSSAPASAAGAGIRSRSVVRYRLASTTVRTELVVPGVEIDRVIGPDDELVWCVFPAFDAEAEDVLDGYRAAAVTIEIVTESGDRLRDAREADGTPAAAAGRVDLDFPDQWNERRVPLGALAGSRVRDIRLVVDLPPTRGRTGETLEGWIDGIRIEPRSRRADASSPAERVPTTRGSHSSPDRSRGLTQPLTGVPHGGVFLAPATDLSNPHWTYSWNAHGPGPNPSLAGVLLTRSPSIWIGDRGAVAFRVGLVADAEQGVAPEEFTHDDERATPHRYGVTTLSGIRLDGSATDHAAVITVDFPARGRVVLCAPGSPLSALSVRLESGGEVRVSAASTLPNPHEPDPLRAFYSISISGADLSVNHVGETLVLDVVPTGRPLRIEVGTSQLSSDQAEVARGAVAGVTVDSLASAARDRWDAQLAIVSAPAGTTEQRMLVASDLYRLFVYPTRHDEDTPDGPRYPSPTRRLSADSGRATGREIRPGRMLTDNGFWDTYRTAWPAYALLDPARAGALLDGMLEHVRDGGWSARWTAGTPLDAMVGTSLDVIAADLVEAGVPGIDLETAYLAALRNATAASSDPRFGRKGMPDALVRGYVDATHPESVSWTLEGAISDGGAAVLARALARTASGTNAARLRAESRYLAHRATAYRSVWDPTTRFFRPRDAEGVWADEPFDPRVWGGGHTETNAWGSRFSAPHDGAGLAELFGGATALGDALDEYFREQETARAQFVGTYPGVIHEMPEARDVRRGMWGLNNQPAHHVPWLYAHTDRPWRADEVIGDAVLRMFRGTSIGQGFPGDEDNGEMSAWHLFSVLGFAPFAPGSGRLLVTAPQVDHLEVRPRGAAGLDIVVHRDDPTDRYIQGVRFNGVNWTQPTIGIAELHEGGLWEVTLGAKPVVWSEPLDSRPHFAPDGVSRVGLTVVGEAYIDAVVEPDQLVHVTLHDSYSHSPDPALVVVGLRDAGTHTFSIETSGTIARFSAEEWRWHGEARPFEVRVPGGIRRVGIRWGSPAAHVTFVQLLA